MKLAVVIASIGRPETLAQTLRYLERQSRIPDIVLLSLIKPSDAPTSRDFCYQVRYVYGPRGSSAQRNTGLDAVLTDSDIVTFFDDDFLPAENYLERVETAFREHADYAVIHGNVVADGIGSDGLTFEQARQALAKSVAIVNDLNPRVVDGTSAYGCNMSFRSSLIGDLRFDERLVLYGWQEDRDFSFRVGCKGRLVMISNIVGVHLGVKGGRVKGVRLGYSQVINPIYLVRKGTMPVSSAANMMLRNIMANTVKSIHPEPWVDRHGRLRGNMLALKHAMAGRIDPEYVLNL